MVYERKRKLLQVSYSIYEILLGTVNGTRFIEKHIEALKKANDKLNENEILYYEQMKTKPFYERISDVFYDLLDDLHKSKAIRCKKMQIFTNYESENDFCLLDPDVIRKYTNVKIKNLVTEPGKVMHCSSNQLNLEHLKSNTAITFGKFDCLLPVCIPHAYWSGILRMNVAHKHPVIGNFLGIPSSRIKHTWDRENESVKDIFQVDCIENQEQPFVVWTLVSFQIERNNKREKRYTQLMRLVNSIVGSRANNEGLRKKYPDNRIEAFLSYSTHYPLIVKAEFANIQEIEHYLTKLRGLQGVTATSSILGLKLKDLEKNNHLLNKTQFTNDLSEREIRIGMLLKIQPGFENTVKHALYHDLKSVLNESNELPIVFCDRPAYWDIFVLIKTNKIASVANYIIDYLSERKLGHLGGYPVNREALKGVVTIPFWSTDSPDLIIPDHDPLTKPTHNVHRRKNRDIHYRLIKKSKEIKSLFDECQKFFIESYDEQDYPPIADIVIRQFYGLKYDLEWLYSLAQQTYHAWDFYIKPAEETFYRINKVFGELFRKTIYKGKLVQANLIGSSKKNIWKPVLEMHDKRIGSIRHAIHCMASEYHTKLEGKQVSTMTEPHVLMGARTGVTDMFMDSLDLLLEAYANTWLKVPQPHPSFTAKHHKIWDGLVVVSTDLNQEYWIEPFIQVLSVPNEFKSHVHRRLLPLAHEGVHQLVHDMCSSRFNDSDAQNTFLRIGKEIAFNCRDQIKQVISAFQNYWGGSNKCFRFGRILTQLFEQDFKLDMDFYCRLLRSEIIVDILSFLAAGPALASNYFELYYSPAQRFGRRHLPLWMRILSGLTVFESMGIPNNPWTETTALGYKTDNNNESLRDALYKFETQANNNIKTVWNFVLNGFPENKIETNKLFTEYSNSNHPLLDSQVYIASALFMNDQYLLRKLIKWCNRFSHDFLFYPLNGNNTLDMTQVEKIHEECWRIAIRLLYNEEIILTADVRQIAAATMLPIMRRPVIPCGRIIHSLFYASKT
jgi:hypothetical protein